MSNLVEIRGLNIRFTGERTVHAVNELSLEELSAFRGQTVSMIFQEPALALDPVYTIGQQLRKP
jgi:peptide/nickel transport system ATP-binding protein